jgi:hypothetical protein
VRESQIEKALVRRVKLLGGEIRKVAWISRRGAPDRLLLFPPARAYEFAMAHGLVSTLVAWQHPLVELKRPGKDAEDHQAREHERLRAAGFLVLVIDTLELIDKYFPVIERSWSDYEMSVRCANLLKSNFTAVDIEKVAAVDDVTLRRYGFRMRDIKEIREAAANRP